MPPKNKFTRDEIVTAALALTREAGIEALTARTLAARLGTSTKPIFGAFSSMDEVREAVSDAAMALYQDYLREDMERGKYPPYKASGMGYIRFAREEPPLFRLLFMCDRSDVRDFTDPEELPIILSIIRNNLGLSEEDARLFHIEMWVAVHGIAVMTATSYLPWDEEMISTVLSDIYLGLSARFKERRNAE